MVLHQADVPIKELIPGIMQRHCWDKATGAEGVSMGVITLAPGTSLPAHHHKVEDAMVVISGKGLFVVDDEATSVDAGCALLAPAEASHFLVNDGTEPLVIVYTWPAVQVERFISD